MNNQVNKTKEPLTILRFSQKNETYLSECKQNCYSEGCHPDVQRKCLFASVPSSGALTHWTPLQSGSILRLDTVRCIHSKR
jgi:hypothetical protein